MASPANTSTKLLEGSFCDTFFDVSGILAYVAAAFLVAGLLIGLAAAIVGIVRGPATPNPGIAKASDAILEALKGLIEALSAAPAWLGMFGAGILLFWLVGNVVPDTCKDLAVQIASKASAPPAPGKPGDSAVPRPKDQ